MRIFEHGTNNDQILLPKEINYFFDELEKTVGEKVSLWAVEIDKRVGTGIVVLFEGITTRDAFLVRLVKIADDNDIRYGALIEVV